MNKKTIGLLGGFSHVSTIDYYSSIMDAYYNRFHDYYYPELSIYSLDFQKFTDMEDQMRMDEYKEYIKFGVENIAKSGADFFAMTANSPHSVIEEIRDELPIPVVSIVDSVAEEVKRQGLKKVLLTGIRYTMKSDFYPKGLAKRGIETVIPNDDDKDRINEIIFGELCRNIVKDSTREEFIKIISKYDAEGVLLCCTELPFLLHQKDYDKPVFDSMHIHVKSIMEYAIED